MATAYAAVVSLINLMEPIQLHHARHSVFLDEELRLIESLRKRAEFLLDFLECDSYGGNQQSKGLESRITEAAYTAEDIIECHIVDDILARSKNQVTAKFSNKVSRGLQKPRNLFRKTKTFFSEDLEKVIEDMDLIRREVMEEKIRHEIQRSPTVVPESSLALPPRNNKMVGFGEELISIMDELTGGKSNLQIIPITGMGGIGKTTLAQNAFDNLYIEQYFHIRAWVTISQQYNAREILLGLLQETGGAPKNQMDGSSEDQLGEQLYKHLSGKRYLIAMDDVWSTEAFGKIKPFLPDNCNGSRILVTTRLSEVANSFVSSAVYKLDLLDEEKSWTLLREKVFGHADCPLEMEEMGKKIARNCRGLPLSIVVIGGLLVKSKTTLEYWKHVAKDINAIVYSEDGGHYQKILSLSYSHLPFHLRPCFLYMGSVFPEDHEIRVSRLIKLWVAEGFIKPNSGNSLEEVAEECLKDLIGRNLILVRKWGPIGNMKTCGVHDLLRDLCWREAQNERFVYSMSTREYNSLGTKSNRRIIIHGYVFPYFKSASFARSLTSFGLLDSLELHDVRLLRVANVESGLFKISKQQLQKTMCELFNWRYFAFGSNWFNFRYALSKLYCDPVEFSPSTFHLFWSIQTLIIDQKDTVSSQFEIWKMPQLRHVYLNCVLSVPCSNDCVLENLQTLKGIRNFRCTEEVLSRIPSIKKLDINYERRELSSKQSSHYCLQNFFLLQKLQSLKMDCSWGSNVGIKDLRFPHSLKKLALERCNLEWDDISTKIGSLASLEVLKLHIYAEGEEWNPVDGQFICLKSLQIMKTRLAKWTADSGHFPRLEHLHLEYLLKLKEIPSGIGEIPTLRSIELEHCSASAAASALCILEEQQSFGNEGLRLTIRSCGTIYSYVSGH